VVVVLTAVLYGPPYSHLDCTAGGYHYGHSSENVGLKNPESLCRKKKSAVSPLLFDLRVHVEQKLGLRDYTYDNAPTPTATLLLANGSRITKPCKRAAAFVRTNPEQVQMAFWDNAASVTLEKTDCGEEMEPAMEYAERIQNGNGSETP